MKTSVNTTKRTAEGSSPHSNKNNDPASVALTNAGSFFLILLLTGKVNEQIV